MLTAAGCVAVIAQLWSLPAVAIATLAAPSGSGGLEATLPQSPIVGRLLNGTAFFVDQSGSMLTARHAVDHVRAHGHPRVEAVGGNRCALHRRAAGGEYDHSAAVPTIAGSWTQFAKLVKYRFENGLAPTMPLRRRFRVFSRLMPALQMVRPDAHRAGMGPIGGAGVVSGPWRCGAVSSVRGNIGERPPPEMLQPIRLRFGLGAAK